MQGHWHDVLLACCQFAGVSRSPTGSGRNTGMKCGLRGKLFAYEESQCLFKFRIPA